MVPTNLIFSMKYPAKEAEVLMYQNILKPIEKFGGNIFTNPHLPLQEYIALRIICKMRRAPYWEN